MSKKIGIEQSLSDVEAALKEKGYEFVTMKTEDDAKGCDCCVVTGLDTDMLGISDTMTGASVIQATGLTADEICQQVEQKLQ
ncbi:YkuS family protein [Bacillus paralicheniformis]|uniref:YkuS family protein n=1 Tax=Bacillus paralicheniformis TaxID=1648923 RepID=UPI0022830EC4|nr:YkuS family protein [Bacillus paralicheniformis]MCY9422791.1 YkuS family protein [Bacillus paralicheniformis]